MDSAPSRLETFKAKYWPGWPTFLMCIHLLVSITMTGISGAMLGKNIEKGESPGGSPEQKIGLKYAWVTSAVVLFFVLAINAYNMEGGLINVKKWVLGKDFSPYPRFKTLSIAHILVTALMTFFSFYIDLPVWADVIAWGVSIVVIGYVLVGRFGGYTWFPGARITVTP